MFYYITRCRYGKIRERIHQFQIAKPLCDRKVAKLSAGIALSAKQRFQYPDNREVQAAWNNLLKVLGKESLAQEEFAGNAVP
jgi:hypothetical protein